MVEGEMCREEYIGYTLCGNVKEAMANRKMISIDSMLSKVSHNGCSHETVRLILIEGAPGIGKSTLAWEICRSWDSLPCMKSFNLVVLLRLREAEVQRIANVDDIFFSYAYKDRQCLVDEIVSTQGKEVLFVLDGFDELPKELQTRGLLLDLLIGRVLPDSTVIVTSRPSATTELLVCCQPQKRIEILGFTQESIERYASSVFLSPKELDGFKMYIAASENPAINSLMYVPLNAVIIVQIYRSCKSRHLLPHTLTEVYKQLCLTVLNRSLKSSHPTLHVNKFEDLPGSLYKNFLELSSMAYEGVKNRTTIFHSLPPDLVHFGFLDAAPALYGGDMVSFNFLHLTIQEFFAACYIASLPLNSSLEAVKNYFSEENWNVVWRFVAGLTQFEHCGDYFSSRVANAMRGNRLKLPKTIIQCLFEAQSFEWLRLKHHLQLIEIDACDYTAMDRYALGYCISSLSGLKWDVTVYFDAQHFMCGLDMKLSSAGIVEKLHLISCTFAKFVSPSLLSALKLLRLYSCDLTYQSLTDFSHLIPQMTSLEELNISCNKLDEYKDGLLSILQQLCTSSTVSALDIRETGLFKLLSDPYFGRDYYEALRSLIDPSIGRLRDLRIDEKSSYGRSFLGSLVFTKPSSLCSLMLASPNRALQFAARSSLYSLKNLGIVTNDWASQGACLIETLKVNKTIQVLAVSVFQLQKEDAVSILRKIIATIYRNYTLCSVQIGVFYEGCLEHGVDLLDYMRTYHHDLTLDRRISWRSGCIHYFEDRVTM